MRNHLATLIAVCVVSACAVRTQQYYLSVDSRLAEEGKICGTVPFGLTNVPLGEGLSALLSVTPTEGKIGVALQLALPPGTKVRLLSPEFSIQVPDSKHIYTGRLAPFQVSVYGRGGLPGHHEIYAPDSVLEGKGRNLNLVDTDSRQLENDLYVSYVVLNASPPESFMLLFPAVEVNGIAMAPRQIQLKRIEQTGIMTCIQ